MSALLRFKMAVSDTVQSFLRDPRVERVAEPVRDIVSTVWGPAWRKFFASASGNNGAGRGARAAPIGGGSSAESSAGSIKILREISHLTETLALSRVRCRTGRVFHGAIFRRPLRCARRCIRGNS